MADWLIETAARMEGITDEQIAVIERAIPAMQQLSALYKEAEPLIAKALPLITEVKPAVDILLAVAKQKV